MAFSSRFMDQILCGLGFLWLMTFLENGWTCWTPLFSRCKTPNEVDGVKAQGYKGLQYIFMGIHKWLTQE